MGVTEYHEDCYFYYESQEMSAYVPNCSYDSKYEYGFCPCSENCKHYISRKEAHELIKSIVRCKDCRYATRHCCDSVFGTPLYDCSHVSQIGRDTPTHPENWFCADGEKKAEHSDDDQRVCGEV